MDGFSLSLIITQDGALLEIHNCFIQGFHHGVMMDDAKSVHLQDTTVLHSTNHNIFVCSNGNNELYMDNAKILTTAKDANGLCTHTESPATVEILNSFSLSVSIRRPMALVSSRPRVLLFPSTVVSLLVMVEMGRN
jgi:hypothetical protein